MQSAGKEQHKFSNFVRWSPQNCCPPPFCYQKHKSLYSQPVFWRNPLNVRWTTRWIEWHFSRLLPLFQSKISKYDIFWVCACTLRKPACKAHAPYCHLWLAQLYNIFPHCLINGTICERKKKDTDYKMCVLIFSITFVWNITHRKTNWVKYDQKCIFVFM